MERKYEIYAKQHNPEYVDTSYYLDDYLENGELAIDGGRHYYSYNDTILRCAHEMVDDYYELDYGYYNNFTDYVEYHLAKCGLANKKLAPRKIGALRKELARDDLSTSDYDKNFVIALFKVLTGKEYKTHYLYGSCQGEVVKLYAPKDTDNEVIRNIEAIYWNTGSEITIHDFGDEVNGPEDVEGYSIYVRDCYNEDNIKSTIAEQCDVQKEDVCLWLFDGYIHTPKYRQV